jgi:hypothetical protein
MSIYTSLLPHRRHAELVSRAHSFARVGSIVTAVALTLVIGSTFAAFFSMPLASRERTPIAGPVQVLPTVQVIARA